MYKVERRFTFPMGHRLSKHPGACSNVHGHNITVLVGVKSEELNENDMVIDFHTLKEIVQSVINEWDHCTILNMVDKNDALKCKLFKKINIYNFDPTAERLSEYLYNYINNLLPGEIQMDYIKFYENENSMAEYTE